jgi:hypothetical protein
VSRTPVSGLPSHWAPPRWMHRQDAAGNLSAVQVTVQDTTDPLDCLPIIRSHRSTGASHLHGDRQRRVDPSPWVCTRLPVHLPAVPPR